MNYLLIGQGLSDAVVPAMREGCRGIIEEDGAIYFAQLAERNQYLLPGGRIDDGESLIECVKRECLEELGMVVEVERFVCSIEEHYPHARFKNNYFAVRIVERGLPLGLVDEEKDLRLVPVALDVDGIVDVLLSIDPILNPALGASTPAVAVSHYRESIAISSYLGVPIPPIPTKIQDVVARVELLK